MELNNFRLADLNGIAFPWNDFNQIGRNWLTRLIYSVHHPGEWTIEPDYLIGLDLTIIRARLVLGSDPKYVGPDCNSEHGRVRVDIRIRLEKMEPAYPETGKHPECCYFASNKN